MPAAATPIGVAANVAAMIATDWYGVDPSGGVSPRVLRLGPTLEALAERAMPI